MKKIIIGALILIPAAVMALFFGTSSPEDKDESKNPDGDIILYYISVDGTSFCEVPYDFAKPGKIKAMAE